MFQNKIDKKTERVLTAQTAPYELPFAQRGVEIILVEASVPRCLMQEVTSTVATKETYNISDVFTSRIEMFSVA